MKPITMLLLLFTALHVNAVAHYPNAKFRLIKPAECINTGYFLEQYAPAVLNRTNIHVRHMGDVNTPEWLNQTGTNISWNVGQYTGLNVPQLPYVGRLPYQVGHEDDPFSPKNAYQVNCTQFGFYINTYQFGHDNPIACPAGLSGCSGGSNITYARNFSPAVEVWRNESSELTLQAKIKLPYVHYTNPIAAGQISFFYTGLNTITGELFFGLAGIFDSRTSFNERIGNDGNFRYTSSNILNQNPSGSPLKFLTKSPYSSSHQNQTQWVGERFYRAHVSWENMENIIAEYWGENSYLPSDIKILETGILIEVFPKRLDGSGTDDIILAGSIDKFKVLEAYDY